MSLNRRYPKCNECERAELALEQEVTERGIEEVERELLELLDRTVADGIARTVGPGKVVICGDTGRVLADTRVPSALN